MPLLDFRVHQRRLLPALARTYALHFTQEGVVAELDRIFGADDGTPEQSEEEEQARRELETRAAGLKALATWHATETIQECREACGGAGYLTENRLGELKADTDVFTTFEGDNTILSQLVAKSLLTGYRDDFVELNPIATAGFVADQVWETVIEKTAAREVIQRLTDDLVPGREKRRGPGRPRVPPRPLPLARGAHPLRRGAAAARAASTDGGDPFDVFNDARTTCSQRPAPTPSARSSSPSSRRSIAARIRS